MKGKRQQSTTHHLDGKGLGVKDGDPDGYHAWLIGKGYAPATAMRMVAAKFDQADKAPESKPGWAWKD